MRESEVRRLLDRYLVEVVEAYNLCPWARAARLAGELAVAIVWGTPTDDDFVAAAEKLLPGARVVMIVAPELAMSRADFRAQRDRVAARLPAAGVADFHPDAPLDLATPARLVPFVRRSPDPLLQLVPLALLDAVRAPPPVADRARQAEILAGAAAPRGDVADAIAAANHATVTTRAAEIAAVLDEIAADRARSYVSASR